MPEKLECVVCGAFFLRPPSHARAYRPTCSLTCRYELACQHGHHRPRNTQGQGCLICRQNRVTWYGHGRNLNADLAWAKAVAPDVEKPYDEWVEILRSVVLAKPPAMRVKLFGGDFDALLARTGGVDSLGRPC